jgi:uncharacterized protein (TIGR03437 family)
VAGEATFNEEGSYSGDGGPATLAALDLGTRDYVKPGGSTYVDIAGNLYIADYENSRIRKVTSTAEPVLPAGSVANAAGFVSGTALAPGSLVSIFGHFLTTEMQPATSALPLMYLGGSRVTIANLPAPLLYVSPEQINAQIPFEVPLGETSIEVRTSNGTASASLMVAAASPGIFTIAGSTGKQGAVLTQTGEVAAPDGSAVDRVARPARRGEFISIYATGLGDVTHRPASGAPAPNQTPFSETVITPTVWIGGVSIAPTFSGLAPNFVGLYQVNARVPAEVPRGDAVPMMMQVGGMETNVVTLAVQ